MSHCDFNPTSISAPQLINMEWNHLRHGPTPTTSYVYVLDCYMLIRIYAGLILIHVHVSLLCYLLWKLLCIYSSLLVVCSMLIHTYMLVWLCLTLITVVVSLDLSLTCCCMICPMVLIIYLLLSWPPMVCYNLGVYCHRFHIAAITFMLLASLLCHYHGHYHLYTALSDFYHLYVVFITLQYYHHLGCGVTRFALAMFCSSPILFT